AGWRGRPCRAEGGGGGRWGRRRRRANDERQLGNGEQRQRLAVARSAEGDFRPGLNISARAAGVLRRCADSEYVRADGKAEIWTCRARDDTADGNRSRPRYVSLSNDVF